MPKKTKNSLNCIASNETAIPYGATASFSAAENSEPTEIAIENFRNAVQANIDAFQNDINKMDPAVEPRDDRSMIDKNLLQLRAIIQELPKPKNLASKTVHWKNEDTEAQTEKKKSLTLQEQIRDVLNKKKLKSIQQKGIEENSTQAINKENDRRVFSLSDGDLNKAHTQLKPVNREESVNSVNENGDQASELEKILARRRAVDGTGNCVNTTVIDDQLNSHDDLYKQAVQLLESSRPYLSAEKYSDLEFELDEKHCLGELNQQYFQTLINTTQVVINPQFVRAYRVLSIINESGESRVTSMSGTTEAQATTNSIWSELNELLLGLQEFIKSDSKVDTITNNSTLSQPKKTENPFFFASQKPKNDQQESLPVIVGFTPKC